MKFISIIFSSSITLESYYSFKTWLCPLVINRYTLRILTHKNSNMTNLVFQVIIIRVLRFTRPLRASLRRLVPPKIEGPLWGIDLFLPPRRLIGVENSWKIQLNITQIQKFSAFRHIIAFNLITP
ncbi:Hypothetical_protein [Hexamita inflata]|uniref:Hypothetical_protein n=1 Tax=Hexamita inflata TaxID=28002 RepID=A0AA86UCT5_9EUKA|nr:Hypothetical protein HINF_LOCUS33632 [Hexamita inflata]